MDSHHLLERHKGMSCAGKMPLHRNYAGGPYQFTTEWSWGRPYRFADRLDRFVFKQYLFRFLALTPIVLALSACTSNQYMGISLNPGAVTQELQELARRARAGDKQAQLTLGIRYEMGQGLSIDLKRARTLYMMAAGNSSKTVWIYSPSPGGGAPARVLQIDRSPIAGLEEAKRRLRGLGIETR